MTIRVFFISIVGICVVFAFLILMYLILSSFKFFIHDRRKKKSEQSFADKQKLQPEQSITEEPDIPEVKKDIKAKGEISQEEIAAVMAVLNNHNKGNLSGKKVIINKI